MYTINTKHAVSYTDWSCRKTCDACAPLQYILTGERQSADTWQCLLGSLVTTPTNTHKMCCTITRFCHHCTYSISCHRQSLPDNVSQRQDYITTDSQSASPSWCQAPIWDTRQIYLSPWNFFRQLLVCYFVAPSLTRGRVYNFTVAADSRQSSPNRVWLYFIVPILETSPNWRVMSPEFISPRNRVA
jgi:hypothetical protein